MSVQRTQRSVLIGIGNPDCGDDGAGRKVARSLVGKLPGQVQIIELDGEVTALLHQLRGADAAVLIDACRSGSVAGTVHRFDVAAQPLPRGALALSSHGVGVAEAIELARVLGDLPPACVVYAIEAECVEPGSALSTPVAAAVAETAARVRGEFERLAAAESCDA